MAECVGGDGADVYFRVCLATVRGVAVWNSEEAAQSIKQSNQDDEVSVDLATA